MYRVYLFQEEVKYSVRPNRFLPKQSLYIAMNSSLVENTRSSSIFKL
ncbi:hypothetical protein AAJ76_2600031547 [Vairimorpha ceranae]|uniref:Uncharacterized protein n=1 Tax=Vairimorpha ceranae TaxID=40302 RepID=A0A0F9ZCA8_9MICR|nr:hypothetical protein AAJ76_2600031547 [Vairimorpha ceranae]KKO75274.1 hypothetical protein AAJ76_2600031547 [Vairimorpha ceranae]